MVRGKSFLTPRRSIGAEVPEFSGVDEQTFSGSSPSLVKRKSSGCAREGSHASLLHARWVRVTHRKDVRDLAQPVNASDC